MPPWANRCGWPSSTTWLPATPRPGSWPSCSGWRTNLLAHHLKVLEEAGVIRRLRSEGDRRRSYVQLRLDNPTVRRARGHRYRRLPAGAVPRVLFVCTANSARSQLAAAGWRRVSSIPAASAGTHPAQRIHPRAVAVGRRHGLPLGRAATHATDDVEQPRRPRDCGVRQRLRRTHRASSDRRCTGRSRTQSAPTPTTPSKPPSRQIADRVEHLAAAINTATGPSDSRPPNPRRTSDDHRLRRGTPSPLTSRSPCATPPPGLPPSSTVSSAPRRSSGSSTPHTTSSPAGPPWSTSCR